MYKPTESVYAMIGLARQKGIGGPKGSLIQNTDVCGFTELLPLCVRPLGKCH